MISNIRSGKIFKIQKIKKWSEDEDKLLLELVKSNQRNKWKIISQHFSNKTPSDCRQRYDIIQPNITRGRWKKEEDQKILKYIGMFGPKWSKIAKKVTTRTAKQIRERYVNRLDGKIKKTNFTFLEDLKLLKLQKKFGNKWKSFCKHLPGRTAGNIKNRFNSAIKNNVNVILFIERRDFGVSIVRFNWIY